MERRYSVSEIDAMRDAIRNYGFGSGGYYEVERAKEIEERIRTYMIAGVDPGECCRELRKNYWDKVENK